MLYIEIDHMNSFTIKDLENLSGVKAHTLRIWEQRYDFLRPNRTDTNIRYYSNDQLRTILNVSLLNKYGYKISHINKMSDEEIREKIISLNQQQALQDRIVNELVQQMVDLDTHGFEQTLSGYILTRGIERTITQIIFQFLEKIGILWLTNHINPAQEHLVTNIIRHKLIVGIEGISTPLVSQKTILLFLPESEYHELGLLFIYYLLKNKGIQVVYLGCNVPLSDVSFVVKYKKPDYIYTHITRPGNNFNMEKLMTQIGQKFTDTKCIISGAMTQYYDKAVPPTVTFKKSLTEVTDFISNL